MNARKYIEKGVHYLVDGRFNDALKSFDQALEFEPTSEGFYYKGKTLREINLHAKEYVTPNNELFSLFSSSIELDNFFLPSYYNRALIFFEEGKYTESIDDLNYCLANRAKFNNKFTALAYSSVHFQRAFSYFHLLLNQEIAENDERLNLIIKDIEQFQTLSSWDKGYASNERCAWAFMMMAWAYKQQKKYQKAVDYYDSAMRLSGIELFYVDNDTKKTFYLAWASLLLENNKTEAALNAYAAAYHVDKIDRELKDTLKNVFEKFVSENEAQFKKDKKILFSKVKKLPEEASNVLLQSMYYQEGKAGEIVWAKKGFLKTRETAGTLGEIKDELEKRGINLPLSNTKLQDEVKPTKLNNPQVTSKPSSMYGAKFAASKSVGKEEKTLATVFNKTFEL